MTSATRDAFSRLIKLAYPIIGLNVLNVLSLAVDTAMCGRLPNAEVVLTALGFATQIIFLLMVAMMGLTVGTVALVARAYGSGDTERVNHILQQSTMLTLGVGLLVAVVGNLVAGPILHLLGASDAVRDTALLYLRPLLTGTVFYYLSMLFAGVLRGVGNTMLPFLVALGSNLINFAINYCLILGHFGFPALGIQGAAIGTLVSYMCGVVALVVMMRRGVIEKLTVRFPVARLDRPLATTLVRIGMPAAMDMVILNASFLSIVGMLGHIEQVAVAAHGIGLRIQALAFVPGMSIAQATGALVGQALGGGDAAKARSVVRASITLCVAVMSALALVIVLAAPQIVTVFDVPPGSLLETLSVEWMRVLGCGMPIIGVNIAFVGMFQGAGATRTSLAINTASTLLIQIPLSALLGFTFGLGPFGVWLAFPLSFLVKVGLSAAAYRFSSWDRVGARV